MDTSTEHTIRNTVADILRSADIDSVTEHTVRLTAAAKLNLDFSSLPYKILVREVIESFLLSTAPSPDQIAVRIASAASEIANSGDDVNLLTMQEVIHMVRGKVGRDETFLPQCDVIRHIIKTFFASDDNSPATKRRIEDVVGEVLKSSHMRVSDVLAGVRGSELSKSAADRNVAGNEAGEMEDVKPVIAPDVVQQNPVASDCCRVICKLSNKRDVAVRGSGERSVVSLRELFWKDGKQIPQPKGITLSNEEWSVFRKSIPSIEEAIQKVQSKLLLRSELETKQADNKHDRSQHDTKQNNGTIQNEEQHEHRPVVASSVGPTPQGLVPVGIIRFDGNNYLQWGECMESYLNHLKISYVLSEQCPSASVQSLMAIQKWIDDDHICRQNILNSLCDNLFSHYSKKQGSARDLWEELKLIYLNEEYGANISLVKKYLEFQIVEEKSLFEQVQELHEIADSLIASGMYVEEKFHVNVIISKLPPSWKPFSAHLMKEDYLPVWKLMNLLKNEEEKSRGKGNRVHAYLKQPSFPVVQPEKISLGPQRTTFMKKAGVPEPERDRRVKFCTVCKKKGHLPEQCRYQKSGGKDITSNRNDNFGSVNGAHNTAR